MPTQNMQKVNFTLNKTNADTNIKQITKREQINRPVLILLTVSLLFCIISIAHCSKA